MEMKSNFLLILIALTVGITAGLINCFQPKHYSISLVPQKSPEILLHKNETEPNQKGNTVDIFQSPGKNRLSTPTVIKSPDVNEMDARTHFEDGVYSKPKKPTSTPDSSYVIPVTGGSPPTVTPEIEVKIPARSKYPQCTEIILFDSRGNPYYFGKPGKQPASVKDITEFQNYAPLFRVEPYSSILCGRNESISIHKLDPSIAAAGEIFYPFLITVSTDKKEIVAGGSYLFSVNLGIPDYANSEITEKMNNPSEQKSVVSNLVFLDHVDPGQKLTADFSIICTNFNFSSIDQGKNDFGISTSMSHSWIISPKNEIAGNQVITILIQIDEYSFPKEIPMVVLEKGEQNSWFSKFNWNAACFFANATPLFAKFVIIMWRNYPKILNWSIKFPINQKKYTQGFLESTPHKRNFKTLKTLRDLLRSVWKLFINLF